MKIAIISDIHDNLTNLQKAINFINEKKIKQIICCGDITNNDSLKYLSKNLNGTMHLVRGNADSYDEENIVKYKNIINYGKIARFELDSFYVGICHEPWLSEKVLEKGECDIIFYGHTHKPWIDNKGSCKLVNPGTLGGMFQCSTIAHWDTRNANLELVIIDDY